MFATQKSTILDLIEHMLQFNVKRKLHNVYIKFIMEQ